MALDVGAPLIAALMLAGGGLGSTIVRFTITADGMGPIVVADLSADEVGTLVAVSGCTSSRGRRAMRCPSGDGRGCHITRVEASIDRSGTLAPAIVVGAGRGRIITLNLGWATPCAEAPAVSRLA